LIDSAVSRQACASQKNDISICQFYVNGHQHSEMIVDSGLGHRKVVPGTLYENKLGEWASFPMSGERKPAQLEGVRVADTYTFTAQS
jgi:hypothetical protein